MEITEILPGGPVSRLSPAEVGDILIEIDGLKVNQELLDQRGAAGTSFAILKSNIGNAPPQVFRGTDVPPISSTAIAVGLLIIGTVFALTSFFVFSRSTRSPQVLVLSLLLIVMAIGFAISPASARWFHWPSLLGPLVDVWAAALFVMFFFLFPLRRVSNKLISAAVLYGMPIGVLTISILYVLTFEMGIDIYNVARQLLISYVGLGAFAGIAFLVLAFATTSSSVSKEQLRIMVVGISAGILPFALLTILPQSVGLSPYVQPEITVFGIVIVPLSFAFAIHRYRFMDIRRLVHRSAAYALISLSVLMIYGLLIGVIRVLAGTEVSESLSLQVTLMVLLFAVLPFVFGARQLAYGAVDRILYREYFDHPELNRRLSVEAATAQNANDLSTNVLGTMVKELRLSFASFSSVTNNTTTLNNSAGAVPVGVLAQVAALDKMPSNGHVSYSESAVDRNYGDALLVEMKRMPNIAWVLCLGPKVTEEPFSWDDVELAQSVAGHLATVSEKLELLDELQTKNAELTAFNRRLVETEEAERSRIASYLHDEPLQDISNLIWRYPGAEIPDEVGSELRRIAGNLRNFTARLQPAQLTDLGLVRSLEWLATEAASGGEFHSTVDAGPLGRGDRLDNPLELALYRIAQEALSNCQHHSKASNVWLRLTHDEDWITLVVEDDGIGFVPTDRSDASKQLGLIGMRQRADQLGGQLEIKARQPHGTKIVASLPCGSLNGLGSHDKAGL